MLLTIAAFIFVLGVLIFVHELGHFMAAKSVGIAVPRFSIGLGPITPLRFERGGTEYVLSWIPFGGYVKMASREEQEAMASLEGGELDHVYPNDQLFESKSLWARILVISAGVIMNFLFAWATYSGLALVHGKAEDPTTTLSGVVSEQLPEAASPLAEVPRGTRIVAVNGEPVESWNDVVDQIFDPTSERLRFELEGADPVVLEIAGTEAEARAKLASSLIPLWEPRIDLVQPGKPAAEAGMESGDLIVAIDGEPVAAWDQLVTLVRDSAGEERTFTVERGGESLDLAITPAEESVRGAGGEEQKVGQIGVTPRLEEKRVRFGFVASIAEGGRRTWANTVQVLYFLKGMILGDISTRELGGPILIGQASGQFARAGFSALLVFMAFLSVNLAVLNLLPIPVLDGGHLVFLVLEGLRGGKPLSLDLRQRLIQVGLFVLLGIMVLAIGNDLFRVFGR